MATLRSSPLTRATSRHGLTLLELLVVLVILLALSTLVIPTIGWLGERSQEVATLENLHRLREMLTNQYMVDMGELPRPRTDDDERELHPQLVFLFVNPDTYDDDDSSNDWTTADTHTASGRPTNVLSGRQWNGPYLQHSGAKYYITDTDTAVSTGSNYTARYGIGEYSETENTRTGDPTVVDAWSNPIVIQEPDLDDDDVISDEERRHTRIVSAGRNGRIETDPDILMPDKDDRGDDLVLFLFRHDDYGDELLELSNE